MKSTIDCIPCLARQALEAIRYVPAHPSVRVEVFRDVLRYLAGLDFDQPPPVAGQWMHRGIRELTGNDDPYREVKERFNRLARGLLPELRKKVYESRDRFRTAVLLAITGNVIDCGAKSGMTEDAVLRGVAEALSGPFRGDIEGLRLAMQGATNILYLTDNAGEIFFDRLLVEELPAERVTVAVRGKPVINDATMADAYAAGLHDIAKVIDNGSDAPGTIVSECSPEFRRCFSDADLIIAKGQGNYETLSDTRKKIVFLFRVKCSVVASQAGFAPETNVLASNLGPKP